MFHRVPSQSGDPDASGRSLGGLVQDLLGHVAEFLDQKLMLLRLEFEENLGALVRHVAILAVGGAIGGLGMLLTSIALALWLADLMRSLTAGFGVTGGALLLLGALIVAVRLRRGVIPQGRLLPDRTTKELRADARWLKNGL